MDRRQFLSVLGTAALAPRMSLASVEPAEPGLMLDEARPFSRQSVLEHARDLASKPYQPRAEVPAEWRDLTYDQYRAMWFDTRNALWSGTNSPVQVDVFHPGLYFPRPVQINAVQDGQSRRVLFDLAVFDKTDQLPDLPVPQDLGYSGLRLRAELEQPGIFTEYMVMQGASYFRAIGTGNNYGLSARGLAIDTADPSGEEFPEFTEFWIERPAPGQTDTVIHALMDSPSVTGCYRFRIIPDKTTRIEVQADIFARKTLDHVGLAPLTSMFLFDETNRERFSDFRPAVHDSDGLLMMNGGGEVIWRPLANPKQLQVSGFVDNAPKGFGLMQRARDLRDFADLEAHYQDRPGLWVQPVGDWGMGRVRLVEIPADKEIYDNIVAYWRPMDPIEAGLQHSFAYNLAWGADPAPRHTLSQVLNTRMGQSVFSEGMIVTIDFADHPDLPADLNDVQKLIRAGETPVTDGVLQRNPETGGVRLAFRFIPGDSDVVEFRAQLRLPGRALSEVWLYRWTA